MCRVLPFGKTRLPTPAGPVVIDCLVRYPKPSPGLLRQSTPTDYDGGQVHGEAKGGAAGVVLYRPGNHGPVVENSARRVPRHIGPASGIVGLMDVSSGQ